MIRGIINIRLNDGTLYSYANKYQYDKTVGGTVLNDGATPSNLLYVGVGSYYYTGYGNDTYEKQTNKGEIKADFEYLNSQLGQDGDEFLLFPEADAKHTDTSILERPVCMNVAQTPAVSRVKIQIGKINSIFVSEKWVSYPDSNNRESGYTLPKSSPDFHGFNEYQELTEKEMGGPHQHTFVSYETVRIDTGGIEEPDIDISIDTGTTADPVTISTTGTYNASQYFIDNNLSFGCNFNNVFISPTEVTREVSIYLINNDTKAHTFFSSVDSTLNTVSAKTSSDAIYKYVSTPANNPIIITVDGTSTYSVSFSGISNMTITEE